MMFSFKRSDTQTRKQLQQLQNEIRRATHDSLFDKLFTLYKLYIEHAGDVGQLWNDSKSTDTGELKRQYMGLFVLDFIYLMHLQWDNLDEGLKKMWCTWVDKLFEEPLLSEIYNKMKNEYDEAFTSRIDRYRTSKREQTRASKDSVAS